MLVSMSVLSPFSPKIMPGYTSRPSLMNKVPIRDALERSTAVAMPAVLAISTPFRSRWGGGPAGRISLNSETRTAVPPVSSRSQLRAPSRAAVEASNLRLCLSPEVSMPTTFAPRVAMRSMTLLLWLLSTSTCTSSHGSMTVPSSLFDLTTEGGVSVISKPSRRISSTRIPSCISPRPRISKWSRVGDSRTSMAGLVMASLSSRSPMLCRVRYLPSLPASGESLTEHRTEMIGGSIAVQVMLGTFACDTRVCVHRGVKPAMLTDTMSPATAFLIGSRLTP
mmetsp:Transcript_19903/g.60050  ORF Transcript_19903/g.60050 Transcript_19903/m.60050 type:complete len:280 (-) Transcript_19903:891-1730(-)